MIKKTISWGVCVCVGGSASIILLGEDVSSGSLVAQTQHQIVGFQRADSWRPEQMSCLTDGGILRVRLSLLGRPPDPWVLLRHLAPPPL